jgi:hypothetical protein
MSDFWASLVVLNMLDWALLLLLDFCVHLRWRSRRRSCPSLEIFKTSLELLAWMIISHWRQLHMTELLTVVSLSNAVLDPPPLS